MLAIVSFSTPFAPLFISTVTISADSCTMPQRSLQVEQEEQQLLLVQEVVHPRLYLWLERYDLPCGSGGTLEAESSGDTGKWRTGRAALRGIGSHSRVKRHSRSRVKRHSCAHGTMAIPQHSP